MIQRSFRPELVLVLLIPLLVTFVALRLFYDKEQAQPQSVDSRMQAAYGDSLSSLVRIAGDDAPTPVGKPKRGIIGNLEFSLAIALLMGLAALLGHYLASRWLWYVVIVLSLGFTLLGSAYVGIKLTAFFVPNLLLAGILTLITLKLFYNVSLIRIRMVLCSVLCAIAVTLYYRLVSMFTHQPFSSGEWQSRFVVALINLIFITFGMSLADLIISRLRLQNAQTQARDDDRDEDDDAK